MRFHTLSCGCLSYKNKHIFITEISVKFHMTSVIFKVATVQDKQLAGVCKRAYNNGEEAEASQQPHLGKSCGHTSLHISCHLGLFCLIFLRVIITQS